ncbi:aldo/keto reductase [Anaerococcus sp. NML200574]|uniref:aldo/keto reductase n=1 Tax=Anaerococcus sp. NML200574 TaxID=2954486 RepID=UPI0022382BFA|nr:aldo/keto reductase [Anaerococcus sp. NML200574]MCW6679320.1 aldo/keto reductase [Anaerococcus sp. NML200574]
MKYFKLNDGTKVPAIGFGTFKITEEADMERSIGSAIEAGYRYFDTAKYYENEDLVGKYLKGSGLKRGEIQVATKVWPVDFDPDACRRSIDNSLKKLDLDYIDVLLLHWYGEDFDKAWKVFQDYRDQGLVKSIGVCNFTRAQLKELISLGEKPVLDQLESHLYFQDIDNKNFLMENGILHQAWGPLSQGKSNLLDEQILKEIGDKYGKTPAQIALKWNIERDTMVLVKSSNEGRIKENISIFDFDLSEEDMNALASLDRKERFSNDPENQEWLDKIRRG